MEKKQYKLAVLSDTHGNIGAFEKAIPLINACDWCIHLGDGFRDIDKLTNKITAQVVRIKGNCDIIPDCYDETVFEVGNTKFLVTHGHYYGVKRDLLRLTLRARELNCRYALYGHTHRAGIFDAGDVICVNPGTLARGYTHTIAVIKGAEEHFETDIITL